MRERLLALVARAHAEAPLTPGLDRQTARTLLSSNIALADEVIRRAERAGLVVVEGSSIRLPGFVAGGASGATDLKARLLAALREAGPEPPSVAELVERLGKEVPALLKLLEKEHLAVPVALDRWFAREGLATLLGRLRAHVQPGRSYTPSDLREPLGITRKWLIPFLEWCDRRRISLRSGDGRTFGVVPEEP
jgi:selenocysteine-specific elongation factor